MNSPPSIPFTPAGYADIQQQYKELIAARPEAVNNLQKAREMGDLSENGYYKAARARLSFLDSRLRHFHRLLKYGKVVAVSTTGAVQIGSHVAIQQGKRTDSFTIVGGYESNPAAGKISHVSPIGRALMGKRPREMVTVSTPAGEKEYTILTVS